MFVFEFVFERRIDQCLNFDHLDRDRLNHHRYHKTLVIS